LAKEITALPAKNAPLHESTCTCSLLATHGLPCRHTLYKHLTGAGPLELKQIHKHWWNYRPDTLEEENLAISSVPDIPLNPPTVNGKGRPVGAIATKKKGDGVNSTKRLPSAFEYELEDELAMAIPPSTAPPVMQGAGKGKGKDKGTAGKKPRGRPRKQAIEQPQQHTQEGDTITVAVTSEEQGNAAISDITTTQLGLQRLEESGEDRYEPGTARPRAHQRIIDGLEAVNPEVEDIHDALLRDLEAEEREDAEDNGILEDGSDETA